MPSPRARARTRTHAHIHAQRVCNDFTERETVFIVDTASHWDAQASLEQPEVTRKLIIRSSRVSEFEWTDRAHYERDLTYDRNGWIVRNVPDRISILFRSRDTLR